MAIDVKSPFIDFSHGCTSPNDLKLLDRRLGFPMTVRVGCNHRFDEQCPECAERWRKKNLSNFKQAISSYQEPRMLTLTLRYDKVTLQGRSVSELWDLKNLLSKRLAYRGYPIDRWVAVVESTVSGVFNHIHIVYDGVYIPQSLIKEQWLDLTKDSFKVDIRYVDPQRRDKISWYLSKYLSKLASCKNPYSLHGAHLVGSHGNNSPSSDPMVICYQGNFEIGFDGWKRARPMDDFDGIQNEWSSPLNRYIELTTHQARLTHYGS